MRAPVTLVRVGPCRSVFVRVGRRFFCRSSCIRVSVSHSSVCRLSPATSRRGFRPRLSDRSDRSDRSDQSVVLLSAARIRVSAPKPFRVFRVFRGFIKKGRSFAIRRPACATALPTSPFADLHPPHQGAGTGHACLTGLTGLTGRTGRTGRWCFCRRSACAAASFIFHLSSFITHHSLLPPRPREQKKREKRGFSPESA